MIDRLDKMESRFAELQGLLADPAVQSQSERMTRLLKEYGGLSKVVAKYVRYKAVVQQKAEAANLVETEPDPDLVELAKAELVTLTAEEASLRRELEDELLSGDELSAKDAIIEIRAGVGGEEAALFATDLLRMYTRYAEKRGWKVELMDSNTTELGGMKEVVFSIQGEGVYRFLRYESGVHRVQRVPQTESAGRIHTSTCTVAVLAEAEDVEVEIRQDDLRIDRFAAGGPGGQHVNKTESAVRILHVPTGVVVKCQDERSQHKNLAKAMRVLRTRIYEHQREKIESERGEKRRAQIGSGDRSEKIRTYNFPENRITDHRIGLRLHQLESVLAGNIDDLVKALADHDREQRLKDL